MSLGDGQMHGGVEYVAVDLIDEEQVRAGAAQAVADEPLSAVVTCAGIDSVDAAKPDITP
ncbi:hypothetical protein [Streptomyces sp. NPDC018833]|uniref:hypothetical protein n=1 Tax=Streptomyces sp. NPDC018833 TaxID=3365053 RepID=UPI0037A0BC31